MLASEYGWAKTEIWENVYLDEAYIYAELIKERKVSQAKKKLLDFKILLQVIHTDKPADTAKILDEEIAKIGLKPDEEPKAPPIPEFDPRGFEALKNAMRANPRMIIKD